MVGQGPYFSCECGWTVVHADDYDRLREAARALREAVDGITVLGPRGTVQRVASASTALRELVDV